MKLKYMRKYIYIYANTGFLVIIFKTFIDRCPNSKKNNVWKLKVAISDF
jgi:hypothetical protein